MAKDKKTQSGDLQEGYQPQQVHAEQTGFRPQGTTPINPQTVKPPKGDTAIVPPNAPPAGSAGK